MKKFSDLGVKPSVKKFTGNKIEISEVLGKEIIVEDFKIEDSKIFKTKGRDKCLHLQIRLNGEPRVIFTSGSMLMDVITKIDELSFPFQTTIIEKNKRLEFS